MQPPRFLVTALAGVLCLTATQALEARADELNWATQRAAELVADGESQEQAGHPDSALSRYREAIATDPTFGQAYLDLGALRRATGDLEEAETAYSIGIDHVFGFTDAYVARASLRLAAGKSDAAISDMLVAASLEPKDVAIANKVCETAISAGKLPLALAAARRLAALARARGDVDLEKTARVTARALAMLLAGSDPVAAGRERNAVRRAIARAP